MISFPHNPDYFNSAGELLLEEDAVELPIQVTGWAHPILIRSLTVPQRNKINLASGVGKNRDWTIFWVQTLIEGVVKPRLSPAHAEQLVESHNGEMIEQLGESIWAAGSLIQVFRRYQEEERELRIIRDQLPAESTGG